MGWWKNFWNGLTGRGTTPVEHRKTDRRRDERRWMGAGGEKPRAKKEPRRRKQRRRKGRRKSRAK